MCVLADGRLVCAARTVDLLSTSDMFRLRAGDVGYGCSFPCHIFAAELDRYIAGHRFRRGNPVVASFALFVANICVDLCRYVWMRADWVWNGSQLSQGSSTVVDDGGNNSGLGTLKVHEGAGHSCSRGGVHAALELAV